MASYLVCSLEFDDRKTPSVKPIEHKILIALEHYTGTLKTSHDQVSNSVSTSFLCKHVELQLVVCGFDAKQRSWRFELQWVIHTHFVNV